MSLIILYVLFENEQRNQSIQLFFILKKFSLEQNSNFSSLSNYQIQLLPILSLFSNLCVLLSLFEPKSVKYSVTQDYFSAFFAFFKLKYDAFMSQEAFYFYRNISTT